MTMERVVRPFTDHSLTPPTILPLSSPQRVEGILYLYVGQIGQCKTFRGSENYSWSFYTIKYPKEKTTSS